MNASPVLQTPTSRSSAELTEVVFGLHWAPAPHAESPLADPANLDAICLLLDSQQRLVETVHPSRRTNVNGSVVHTGDSRTGASTWDDERIFVFLDALPQAVHLVVFAVVSNNNRPFGDVEGAMCHVSDGRMEEELLKTPLTTLGPLMEYSVATLQRTAAGWVMQPGAPQGLGMRDFLPRIGERCGGMCK
jgi:stress response protein SCP2